MPWRLLLDKMAEIKECTDCNKECCKSVIVEIDEPKTREDWDDIRWEVAHENVNVLKDDEGDWCIEFLTPCTKLDSEGKCKIYDKRPRICKKYNLNSCLLNGDSEYYEIIFRSTEEVDKYLSEHPEIPHEKE